MQHCDTLHTFFGKKKSKLLNLCLCLSELSVRRRRPVKTTIYRQSN